MWNQLIRKINQFLCMTFVQYLDTQHDIIIIMLIINYYIIIMLIINYYIII
jgi:hypothetical protein